MLAARNEDAIEAVFAFRIRRQLIAARPGTPLPSTTPEATAFARTGQTSYAGITNETYVGSEQREPGTIRVESRHCRFSSVFRGPQAPVPVAEIVQCGEPPSKYRRINDLQRRPISP